MQENIEKKQGGVGRWIISAVVIIIVVFAAHYLFNKKSEAKSASTNVLNKQENALKGFEGSGGKSESGDNAGDVGGNAVGKMGVGDKDKGSSAMGVSDGTNLGGALQAKSDSAANGIDTNMPSSAEASLKGFEEDDTKSASGKGVGDMGGNAVGKMGVGDKDKGSSAMEGSDGTNLGGALQAKSDSATNDIDTVISLSHSTFIYKVYFGFDIDTVTQSKIDKMQNVIKDKIDKKSKIIVEGHASRMGTEEYNQNLSLRRSEFISEVLIKNLGCKESNIETVGYGESKPVDKNPTLNRRVEIKIY